MRRSAILTATLLLAPLGLGCPGSGTPDAGGDVCRTSNESCASGADCCSGFLCSNSVCTFVGGGNGGNNSSSNSSSGSSTSHPSSSSSSSSSSGFGNSSSSSGFGNSSSSSGSVSSNSSGSSSGLGTSSSGSSSSGAVATTYCDGLGLTSSEGNTVLLETYVFGTQLETDGCSTTLAADGDGAQLQTLGGIYDLDPHDNDATAPADALFPAGCDDLGLSTFTPPSGTPFTTPPTGASTIAAAFGQDAGVVSLFGVVTAIEPWASTPTAYNGSVYLQDLAVGTPPPQSGVLVFFPKADAATYGTAPVRGDVVEVSNVTWSPYKGQSEFTAGATSVVTLLGTASLPSPVSLSSTDVGPTATANSLQYLGMRVVVSDSPFTVSGSSTSGDCPADLEDTVN